MASSSGPPPSTCATRSTSSSTSSAFHEPHADGPVASESASVSACEQLEHERRQPTALGHRCDGAVVVEVAAGGDVGQQEVVAHHACSEHLDVVGRQAHPRADALDELDADLGVIAGIALADVVQQRAEHEQVGSVDPVGPASAALAAASHRCRSTVKR